VFLFRSKKVKETTLSLLNTKPILLCKIIWSFNGRKWRFEKNAVTSQRDSTSCFGESKIHNEVLVGQNEELKSSWKASKLTVLNMKTVAFKVRSSGKQIETDKASRADIQK
jgi:hypothetical protein